MRIKTILSLILYEPANISSDYWLMKTQMENGIQVIIIR